MVICETCGYTALYASDPREAIATIEKRLAEARKKQQIALQERLEEEAAVRMKAQKKSVGAKKPTDKGRRAVLSLFRH